MKEKIKNILFSISIFYSITLIILLIFNTLNLVTEVELNDSEENKIKLNEYKEEVKSLEKNKCTDIINQIIKYYEDTSYNGKISLKEMYNYGTENNLLSYYINLKENCNLSEENIKKYDLPLKVLSASIQQDELYHRYYFQYEINIKDIFTRHVIEANLTNIEYKIRKNLELEIISNLIEISKMEEINNE